MPWARWDAQCVGCGSRERHRLTQLRITEGRVAALSVWERGDDDIGRALRAFQCR